MIPFVLSFLEAHIQEFLPGVSPQKKLLAIKAPGKCGAESKVNFLIYGDDNSLLAACKLPRTPSGGRHLELEAANMRRFSDLMGSCLASTAIPRVLFDGKINGVSVLIEEGIAGRSLRDIGAKYAEYAPYYARCIDWLGDVHSYTCSGRRMITEESLDTWLRAPVEKLLQSTSDYGEEAVGHVRQWVEHAARRLCGNTVPIIAQHGDFNAHNIIRRRSGFGVIDWEDAVFHLPPFLDFNHFVVSNAHILGEAMTPSESFHRAVLTPGPYRTLARDLLLGYCRKLDIPPEFPVLMIPAYLAHVGNSYMNERRLQAHAVKHWSDRLVLFVQSHSVGEIW